MAITISDVQSYINTGSSIAGTISGASIDDVLLAVIVKDDDVATSSSSGWTLVQGFESNNAIYLEVWKKLAVSGDDSTSHTWTGDNEDYTLSLYALTGADYASVSTATEAIGTDAVPISNSITVNATDSVVFSGFGVDGDSTPLTIDGSLTPQVNITSAGGNNAAGQAVGSVFPSTGATGVFTHGMDSADQWGAFTILVEPGVVVPILVMDDIVHASTTTEPGLVQANTLAIDDIVQDSSTTALALTQQNTLALQNITQVSTISDIDLTLAYTLTVNDIAQVSSTTVLALTQANSLTIDNIGQTSSTSSVGLTQANTLSIDNVVHSLTSTNIDLSTALTLSVADIAHTVATSSIGLAQANTLSINNTLHSSTSANVTLSTGITLNIDNIAQSTLVDTLDLDQHYNLSINDISQSVVTSSIALLQHNLLDIPSTLQVINIDNILLTDITGGTSILAIQNCFQTIRIQDNPEHVALRIPGFVPLTPNFYVS